MLYVEHEIEHETYKTWASTGQFNFITSGPGDDDLSSSSEDDKKANPVKTEVWPW